MKKILVNLLILLFSVAANAQVGTLMGTIKDESTGESLIGATVVIKGTTLGAATDLDGNYTIKNVKAGTYLVDVMYISYTTKTIEKVIIVANQTTNLNVSLLSDDKVLTQVEIVTKRRTGTEMSVITELKKADQIAVGVSAAQIAKTQDRDAGAVIRRVPGVSIIDGRFVLIRGLNERYNTVMLNDVITPSLEVDKKAFSFDLIPSSMIDRMLVFKSGGADLPGEFAGGVIKIYTKNIPDENFVSLSLQGGYRSGTTFEKGLIKDAPNSRLLGYDKSSGLPSDFPERITSRDAGIAAGKLVNNNWKYKEASIKPDMRLNLSVGRKFNLGKVAANNLTTVTYSNTWQNFKQTRNRYLSWDEATQKSGRFFEYNDNYTSNNVGVGVISNFNFILSPKTRIDFRNFFNQNGKSENTLRNGIVYSDGSDFRNYAFRFEQRSIYSGQLGGTHNLTDRDDVLWNLGYSVTNRSEPDYKRIRSQRVSGTEDPFQTIIPGSANPFDVGLFFSKLKETATVVNGSWEHKLGALVDGTSTQQKVKVGFYIENKHRDSEARWMSYKFSGGVKDNLLKLPIDQIFDYSNIGMNGFTMAEGTDQTDKYQISSLLLAGYINYTLPIGERLTLVGGIRVENNEMVLKTVDRQLRKINKSYPVLAPIPSLNMSYKLNEKQVLRVAYSYSVNRPEFRELAPFSYYDFSNDVSVRGDTNLKTATIHNVDARWELYPSAGELVTFGVFYKKFQNPIERSILPGSGTSPIYGISNAQSAQNFGAEIEIRKNLEDVFNNKVLKRFTLLFNTSLIKSQIQIDKQVAEASGVVAKRALQGQSPYLVNAGIYYSDVDHGIQINLLYNVFGKRIFVVGNANDIPDQYEMARNIIDLNFTKQLGKNLEIKGGVSDILNQAYRVTQDSNNDGKITKVDENILKYNPGRYLSLGFTYKFN